jgi:homoserine kinase type II
MALDAPAYPRNIQWLARTTEAVQPSLRFADGELLNAALSTVTSLLDRSDAANLPHGIIHGDLFRDNVLFTERGLSGVLDFHHAAAGSWIYDLAVAANDWCSVGDGALDNERVLSLMRSYHSVRPLKLPELWFFPAFALYAALTFWLSRLDGLRTAGEAGRTKNPAEFRRIVQAHMSRFCYLDPRLLH